MGILNKEFLKFVDEAKSRLDDRKLDLLVQQMFSNLNQESIIYSSIQDADNAQRKEEVVHNFREAWELGKKIYTGEFTMVLLTEIAGRVEPCLREPRQDYASLRIGATSLPGISYYPPSDNARIRQDLERMFKVLEQEDLHPVEEAVFLYFHLVRIQPFDNGNKRTASAVMNLTLAHNGLPTIYVTPHERSTYATLLKAAIDGFRGQRAIIETDLENGVGSYTHPDYQQEGFYAYLGKKVLDGLVMAEDKLKRLNKYDVSVSAKSPGALYTVKRRISSWFNRREAVYQVQLDKKRGNLKVVGNISYEVLDTIIRKGNGIKYSISTVEENNEPGPLSKRC